VRFLGRLQRAIGEARDLLEADVQPGGEVLRLGSTSAAAGAR